MNITERLLSTKRHTIGYAVGTAEYTRAQAIKEARAGRIAGVRVCKGPKGTYLSSTVDGLSLYSLPIRVINGRIGAKAKTGSTRVAAKSASKPAKAAPKKSAAKKASTKSSKK